MLSRVTLFALCALTGALTNESIAADGSAAVSLGALAQMIASLGRRFDRFTADTTSRFDRIDAEQTRQRVAAAEMQESLSELLSSTQTPRSAALVDACAQRSVLHISYSRPNATPSICSAFAYRHAANASTKIITAAHCFANLPTGASIALMYLGDTASRTCTLMRSFGPPLDAAVLACSNTSNMAGLLPSSGVRLSQVVAITGFTNDAFTGATTHHLPGRSKALNVDFARIVSVAGPGQHPDGSTCVSGSEANSWHAIPAGYVDRRITAGLRGGPVLDLQCGVIGIAHGRSCDAGVFTSLAAVDEYLASLP